ncbi:MAG: hypothetical protein M5E90_05635 [Asgard group archaeon]|nr:hypothetical protein [Asgard group archaeon]
MHDDNDTNKETTGVEERVSLAMSDDIIPVSPFFFAIRVALNVPEQKERGAATLSINKKKKTNNKSDQEIFPTYLQQLCFLMEPWDNDNKEKISIFDSYNIGIVYHSTFHI